MIKLIIIGSILLILERLANIDISKIKLIPVHNIQNNKKIKNNLKIRAIPFLDIFDNHFPKITTLYKNQLSKNAIKNKEQLVGGGGEAEKNIFLLRLEGKGIPFTPTKTNLTNVMAIKKIGANKIPTYNSNLSARQNRILRSIKLIDSNSIRKSLTLMFNKKINSYSHTKLNYNLWNNKFITYSYTDNINSYNPNRLLLNTQILNKSKLGINNIIPYQLKSNNTVKLQNNANLILKNFFSSINCLISKPNYMESNEKLIIRINYYQSKLISKNNLLNETIYSNNFVQNNMNIINNFIHYLNNNYDLNASTSAKITNLLYKNSIWTSLLKSLVLQLFLLNKNNNFKNNTCSASAREAEKNIFLSIKNAVNAASNNTLTISEIVNILYSIKSGALANAAKPLNGKLTSPTLATQATHPLLLLGKGPNTLESNLHKSVLNAYLELSKLWETFQLNFGSSNIRVKETTLPSLTNKNTFNSALINKEGPLATLHNPQCGVGAANLEHTNIKNHLKYLLNQINMSSSISSIYPKLNILERYNSYFKLLGLILSKLFNKNVELQLIKLYNIAHEQNILAESIAYNSKHYKFRILMKKLKKIIKIRNSLRLGEIKAIENLNSQNKLFINNSLNKNGQKSDLSTNNNIISPFSAAKITGIKIQIAGRLSKEKITPKKTIKVLQRGSLSTRKVSIVNLAKFNSKNKKGAFTVKVFVSNTIL